MGRRGSVGVGNGIRCKGEVKGLDKTIDQGRKSNSDIHEGFHDCGKELMSMALTYSQLPFNVIEKRFIERNWR